MKRFAAVAAAGLMVLGLPFLPAPALSSLTQAQAFDEQNVRTKGFFSREDFYYAEQENTTLCLAAQQGMTTLVNTMLDRGAEVNGRDDNGFTPLIRAAQYGKPEAVQILLDRGADITLHDFSGYSALHWSVANNYSEVTSILLFRGAPVNWRVAGGPTPLELGRALNHQRLVAKMINGKNQNIYTIPNAADYPIRNALNSPSRECGRGCDRFDHQRGAH